MQKNSWMTKNSNNINEFISLINLKVKLSDFIGRFINLSEKGNSFVGKCPFHDEKTPSFNVNNEKGLFIVSVVRLVEI